MKNMKILTLNFLLILLVSVPLKAQESGNDFKEQFNQQFSYSSRVLQLAEAMPADKYTWRPMEGVSSVGEVYIHIAQANYSMLNALGVPAPEEVDVQNMDSITGKEDIVDALEQSLEFVKTAVQNLPDSKLSEEAEIYGRTTNGQGILIMMLSHMSEHVGQSIAYARTNEVVPPWSE